MDDETKIFIIGIFMGMMIMIIIITFPLVRALP